MSRRDTVVFNCSPSLGILDIWIPVIFEIKKVCPELRVAFLAPLSTVLNQVDLDSTLIKISSEIFDKVIFKSDLGLWLEANDFGTAKNLSQKSTNRLINFISRALFKKNILGTSKFWNFILALGGRILFHKNATNLEYLESRSFALLCDIEESRKQYCTNIFNVFSHLPKFSMLHGICISGYRSTNVVSPLSIMGSKITAYTFSDKDKEYYDDLLRDNQFSIKALGVARHEERWMSYIIERDDFSSFLKGDFIFLISRPAARTVPMERKRRYVEYIKNLSSELKLNIVIKRHPKEVHDDIYMNILGRENYNKTWAFSNAHPFSLASQCKFAVAFYSGVVIDLIPLGTPCIELLDLSNLPAYLDETFLVNSSGTPITEYRYFGLVLGASTYDELKDWSCKILEKNSLLMDKLIRRYSELFPRNPSINKVIAQDILDTI